MSVDIAHNRDDIAQVEVSYLGEKVVVFYRPGVMTGEWAQELAVAGSQADMYRVYRLWSEVIESWDVIDNGEPLATDADGIAVLPIPLMQVIFTACQSDAEMRGRRTKRVSVSESVLGAIFGNNDKGGS